MQLLGAGGGGEGIRLGGPLNKGKSQLHECMQTYIQSLTFLAFPYIIKDALQILKFVQENSIFFYQSKKATAPKIFCFRCHRWSEGHKLDFSFCNILVISFILFSNSCNWQSFRTMSVTSLPVPPPCSPLTSSCMPRTVGHVCVTLF